MLGIVYDFTDIWSSDNRTKKMVNNRKKVEELLADRLSQPGDIRPQEAWKICRNRVPGKYSSVINSFRAIMNDMEREGKAEQTGWGRWRILETKKAGGSELEEYF